MARYLLGQPVRVSTTVRDAAGTLVDPTVITVAVLAPAGTQVTYTTATSPAVVRDSVGAFHLDLPSAAAGHFQYVWTTTGSAAGVSTGAFDVVDPFDSELLSLDDAKQTLNLTSTTNDAELELYVAAVTDVVEAFIGPVGRRTVTETIYAEAGGELVLSTRPAISLTSLTPTWGSVYTVGQLILDATSGIIRPPTTLQFWGGPFIVVYVAGRPAVPPSVNLAARMLVEHLWATQRGEAGAPRLVGATDDYSAGVTPGFGFAVPNRVLELLEPYRIPSGVG